MSEERVSSKDCCLHLITWMILFSPAVSKMILSPHFPSHSKDVSTTLIQVLPTFIFIFVLPIGTKPDFHMLIQKKRKFTIGRNREYTEPSAYFLHLHRTLLSLFFTWHVFACISVFVIIYWGILVFLHKFADSAFGEIFAPLLIRHPCILDIITLTVSLWYYSYTNN